MERRSTDGSFRNERVDRTIEPSGTARSLQQRKTSNFKCDHHTDREALFYCPTHTVYLCNKCFKNHQDHHGIDFIKNMLTSQFHKWRELKDSAEAITKCAELEFSKYRDFLNAVSLRLQSKPSDEEIKQEYASSTLKNI